MLAFAFVYLSCVAICDLLFYLSCFCGLAFVSFTCSCFVFERLLLLIVCIVPGGAVVCVLLLPKCLLM